MEILYPDRDKSFDKQSNIILLAMVIYGEARGEPIEGQVAIGNVIKNRLENKERFGGNWKEVILKKWQFSCFNENDPNRVKMLDPELDIWEQCYVIADAIFFDHFRDNVSGANHYVNPKIAQPKWIEGGKPVKVIGNHSFYKL